MVYYDQKKTVLDYYKRLENDDVIDIGPIIMIDIQEIEIMIHIVTNGKLMSTAIMMMIMIIKMIMILTMTMFDSDHLITIIFVPFKFICICNKLLYLYLSIIISCSLIMKHNLIDILNMTCDQPGDSNFDFLGSSIYYDDHQFTEFSVDNLSSLTILAMKCQSLRSRFDELSLMLNTYNSKGNCGIAVICLQETWIEDSDPISISLITIVS